MICACVCYDLFELACNLNIVHEVNKTWCLILFCIVGFFVVV
jgi:hypothetical protein